MSGGPILITGGAGFIGSNLADSFLSQGREVIVFDVLARAGVEANLDWLQRRYGKLVAPVISDIRSVTALEDAVNRSSAVFHFAAQVAVTTSLAAPADDFSVNAQGTINLLEAVRNRSTPIPVIFASTNKVYGHLDKVELRGGDERHTPVDPEIAAFGIGESQPLDFATPYGCSKGAADQYVLDYANTFGLPAAVLRMSCIYGPRQFGTEDQGWVAHFLIRALAGEPITIYGDGRQVRDVLHVADAVDAYRRLLDSIERNRGQAFNLGGGPANAVSLRMMLQEIGLRAGRKIDIRYADWRAGDQLYFVADTRHAERELGWKARCGWKDGLRDLAGWVREHSELIDAVRAPEPELMIA
jgi:CDP-paratose 2-epimerase